jgi:hypothetical protein
VIDIFRRDLNLGESFVKIEEKLSILRLERCKENKKAKSVIERIEKRYNIHLPEDYSEFILLYGGSCFEIDDIYYKAIDKIPWLGEEGYGSIYSFYGLNEDESIEEEINTYIGRIPDWLIPIADGEGGNHICIGIKGENINKIFFWDHENELEAKKMLEINEYMNIDVNEYLDNIYLMANSFYDFIMTLENIHNEKLEDENDGIIEFWLSDELLNED